MSIIGEPVGAEYGLAIEDIALGGEIAEDVRILVLGSYSATFFLPAPITFWSSRTSTDLR